MAIERERKFLPNEKFNGNEFWLETYVIKKEQFKQAYLSYDENSQTRIRIIDDEKAFICYKHNTSESNKRFEFEYEIPLEDAKEMYDLVYVKFEKTRYTLDVLGRIIYQDNYKNGLIIFEIEYDTDDMPCWPTWCDKDVTMDEQYSNYNIALHEMEYENYLLCCGSCLNFAPFMAEAGFCKIAECNCLCKNPKAMIDMWDNKCDKWILESPLKYPQNPSDAILTDIYGRTIK